MKQAGQITAFILILIATALIIYLGITLAQQISELIYIKKHGHKKPKKQKKDTNETDL